MDAPVKRHGKHNGEPCSRCMTPAELPIVWESPYGNDVILCEPCFYLQYTDGERFFRQGWKQIEPMMGGESEES